ncbi:hypothetical protein VU05_02300, partial [Desulfobulbus sp. F1]|nr:hypothetical protein [Desulfobulbus sp. F1]
MAPSIDEFEDLTQFADESFDTEEVDLFEFTDDEDSPLLRLKSIVLSLDWDITEEILTELNDELANLRSMWKDDKVAQIYLQGMENVGRYMQAEGAYAHPNAIKLLLTLYHNYEKIISSPNISGDSITAMLKADIRKFKVLQYQISALKKTQGSHDAAEAAPEEIEEGTATTPAALQKQKEAAAAMPPPLRSMEATILGLEWEVTDEGLEKFNTEATQLRSHLSGNTEGQVLIQGLQALGAYIREQKTNAHPDSFTILHSFYDALKMLLESPELGAEQRRQILVEQISSLNSLKEVIARSGASKTAEEAEEEIPEQLEKEPDTAADEEEDVLADDFGAPDEELSGSPALADEDGMNFDFAFDDDEAEAKLQKSSAPAAAVLPEKPVPSKVAAVVTAKPATIAADDEDEFDDDLFSDSGGVTPALADEDEEGGFSDSFASTGLGGERAAELDEKLDSFFNFDDNEEEKPKAEVPKPKVAASVSPAEPQKPQKQSLATILDDMPEEDDEDDTLDSSFFNFDDELENVASTKLSTGDDNDTLSFDDELGDDFDSKAEKTSAKNPVTAVLTDSDEEQRLSTVGDSLDDEDEGDDELDSFFNFDDEIERTDTPQNAISSIAVEEQHGDTLNVDDDMFNEQKEKTNRPLVTAALTDEDEAEDALAVDDDTLSSGLDSFFSFDDEADEGLKTEPTAALAGGDADISLDDDDDMFNEQKEETAKPSVTAALTDEDEAENFLSANFAVDEVEEHGLGSGFDSFFSFDDGDAPKTAAVAVEENEDSLSFDDNMFGLQDEKDTFIAPALVDENEESASSVNEEDDVAELRFDNDIFGEQDEIADEESSVEAAFADEEEVSLSTDRDAPGDDGLDSFFNS